jgi:hypothetical protein
MPQQPKEILSRMSSGVREEVLEEVKLTCQEVLHECFRLSHDSTPGAKSNNICPTIYTTASDIESRESRDAASLKRKSA